MANRISVDNKLKVIKLHTKGYTLRDIAKQTEIPLTSVFRIINPIASKLHNRRDILKNKTLRKCKKEQKHLLFIKNYYPYIIAAQKEFLEKRRKNRRRSKQEYLNKRYRNNLNDRLSRCLRSRINCALKYNS